MERKEKLINTLNKVSLEYEAKLKKKNVSEHLLTLFRNCFINTALTTTNYLDNDEVFLITGDIDAMWLRDSSAQVSHYLPLASKYKEVEYLIKGLIKKQFSFINIDTYANAFNKTPLKSKWRSDFTKMNDYEWERKYELDSLCYPVNLLYDYYVNTKDNEVFTKEVHLALKKIIKTFKIEQYHEEKSKYRFIRVKANKPTVLINDGLGSHSCYTGMIYSCFRASDDASVYGYNIPENLFASKVLKQIEFIAKNIYKDDNLANSAKKLYKEVISGINKYGIVKDKHNNDIYAYEVDGLGNYIIMDDANVPSLLSLPFLKVLKKNDVIYKKTRRVILSKQNPYYFIGKYAKGIGSPHTKNNFIWHMSLIIQGLTSTSKKEKERIIDTLVNTDANLNFMHESFNKDNPSEFSRSWFSWANSLFALLIIDYYKLDK